MEKRKWVISAYELYNSRGREVGSVSFAGHIASENGDWEAETYSPDGDRAWSGSFKSLKAAQRAVEQHLGELKG